MPRYYFNSDNHHHDEDREGTVLVDANEARIQAVVFAGDCLRDHPELVGGGSPFTVSVLDEAGTLLLTVMITAEDPTTEKHRLVGKEQSWDKVRNPPAG